MRRPALTKKRVFLWFEASLQAKSRNMRSRAGGEGGEARAAAMSANSLLLMGGPSLRVSSQLSSLRHQRDQQGGEQSFAEKV